MISFVPDYAVMEPALRTIGVRQRMFPWRALPGVGAVRLPAAIIAGELLPDEPFQFIRHRPLPLDDLPNGSSRGPISSARAIRQGHKKTASSTFATSSDSRASSWYFEGSLVFGETGVCILREISCARRI